MSTPHPTGETPPLVLAHGFTQNARCWGGFGDLLAARRPVRPVDVAGHGSSPPVADLAAAARQLGLDGGWGPYLGYSLGGRVALHLALIQPDLVRALVLIGAHPGIEDDDDRRRRRRADDTLADRLEAIGLEAFLDEWLAQPLFAGLDRRADQRAARLDNDPAALAQVLRRLGTGRQVPLWSRLGALTVPVLYIAGGEDETYRRIGRQFVAGVGPTARLAVIDGVGHAAHLEAPEVVGETVLDFLADVGW